MNLTDLGFLIDYSYKRIIHQSAAKITKSESDNFWFHDEKI